MTKFVQNIDQRTKTKCIEFGSRNVLANATALSWSTDGM